MSMSRNLKPMIDCLPQVGLLSELMDAIFTDFLQNMNLFAKPNDENALNLMNSCAVSMLEQFPDIVFAYGVSDEYRHPFAVLYGRKLLSFTKDGQG
ncbi:unnamed protein product, partial [Musa hybrid cultivar]